MRFLRENNPRRQKRDRKRLLKAGCTLDSLPHKIRSDQIGEGAAQFVKPGVT